MALTPAVDGHSERSQVGVVADALEFDLAAIQQETLRFVEGDGAHAEGGGVAVDHALAVQDFADQGVEIGPVDIPALRVGQRQRRGFG